MNKSKIKGFIENINQIRLKIFIAIILLIFFLIILIIVFPAILKSNNECEDFFIEVTSDFDNLENVDILQSYKNNILINVGEEGEWDENIREIGNIVYSSNLSQYLFFYSAHKDTYEQNDVYIGMAHSEDGINWEKYGKIFEVPAEDPYAIIIENKIYLFYEDKSEIPFKRVDLAISEDGKNWTILKKGVINPIENDWQSKDVSSPVVIETNEGFLMIYEGRGPDNLGKIGLAKSIDCVNWSQNNEPIYCGKYSWEKYVVPDDIFKEFDQYILSYHGYCKKYEWQSGLAKSIDLKNWTPVNSIPIHTSDTIMIKEINSKIYFFGATDEGVEFYLPLKGIKR
jgi:predicted GH43/DUF377 family glycosyl hydrolase